MTHEQEVAYTKRRMQEQASAEALAQRLMESIGPTSGSSDIEKVYKRLRREAKHRKRHDIEGSEYLYEQALSLNKL
jgi:hypothetical protein